MTPETILISKDTMIIVILLQITFQLYQETILIFKDTMIIALF